MPDLNRHIVVWLLLLSPFFLMFQGQSFVDAVMTSTTITQTLTSYITETGINATIQYQTLTESTALENHTVATSTSTSTATLTIPVPVTGVYAIVTTVGKDIVTYFVTETNYYYGVWPSTVRRTVTNRNLITSTATYSTTSTSTSWFTTSFTFPSQSTQTLTSAFDNGQWAISYIIPQNLWIVLGGLTFVAVAIAVRLAHRGGRPPPNLSQSEIVCISCGARIPQDMQYCLNCGTKR